MPSVLFAGHCPADLGREAVAVAAGGEAALSDEGRGEAGGTPAEEVEVEEEEKEEEAEAGFLSEGYCVFER